jgi:hypothetical protein
MIISHQHRFIFAAVPKTGTHAIRRALRAQLGADDLEQVGLFVHKRFPFPQLADIEHGHIALAQIRPILGEPIFGEYFKFAFVRHPFERFVSYCAFMTRQNGNFERDPLACMKRIARDVRPLHHVNFRPQHEFVTDADGRPLADFVGRTEDMQAGFDAVCARLGLQTSELERVNTSSHLPYRHYFDDELTDLVTELYRVDLDMFGYDVHRHVA